MKKTLQDAEARRKFEKDRIDAQYAKMDVPLTAEFTAKDQERAIGKLTDAARKYDPANPGVGFAAFAPRTMKPLVFREMVKRTFFVHLNDRELASMVKMFEREKKNEIVCLEFIKKFNQLGNDEKTHQRVTQLRRTKLTSERDRSAVLESEKKKDEKLLGFVDFSYSKYVRDY